MHLGLIRHQVGNELDIPEKIGICIVKDGYKIKSAYSLDWECADFLVGVCISLKNVICARILLQCTYLWFEGVNITASVPAFLEMVKSNTQRPL